MSSKQRPKQQAERMLTLSKIIGNTSLHNSCFSACNSGGKLVAVLFFAVNPEAILLKICSVLWIDWGASG
jgi:hypothetical protein